MPSENETIQTVYSTAQDIQIEKVVTEKDDNVLMVEGNIGWDDIGDCEVLYKIRAKNDGETVILGDPSAVMQLDTKNTLIQTSSRLVATIGLENIVIIDTPDALLVCAKDRAQDVKKIVEQLKAEHKTGYL